MDHVTYAKSQLDATEVNRRLSMFCLSDGDKERTHVVRSIIAVHRDEIANGFYAHVRKFPELARFIPNLETLRGLRSALMVYIANFGEEFDTVEYFEWRRRIGGVHERIGIKPIWYIAAFSHLTDLIQAFVVDDFTGSPQELHAVLRTIEKISKLDMSLALEMYHASSIARIEGLMSQLECEQDAIRQLAQSDQLTGLMNRRYFMERFGAEFHRCRIGGHPLCLLLIDIDNFKTVNDRYGHPVGDAVLHGIGGLLPKGVRHSDLCGRVGGEELAIVLIETPLPTATLIAERIRLAILDLEFGDDSGRFSPSVSIGVSALTDMIGDSAQLYKTADDALYHAKRSGKNRVTVYNPAWKTTPPEE